MSSSQMTKNIFDIFEGIFENNSQGFPHVFFPLLFFPGVHTGEVGRTDDDDNDIVDCIDDIDGDDNTVMMQ